ncbi:hypothetical protein SDC9_129687 [bioreactor metagenome]|uniref:DegV domain-containing protein n=1 Tax=bioreactor metagenome TaxID=1076179 RepID=A0A645D0J0_9ZZZZ|nr:DegV family protein [Candidatus Metalachnospira sp.]
MSYKIILDSCGELTDKMKSSGRFSNVALSIEVGNYKIVDDETFDQSKFLEAVASTTACPKSACPSPEQYMKAFDCKCERVYVVTLSEKLSGSHNSAVLAKKLYEEVNPNVKIEIFNSKSASAGETLDALKIDALEQKGLSFDEVVEETKKYIDIISTNFVLEDLSFLERNGRLTGVKRLAASILHIVPIMAAAPDGSIAQLDQARGINKAMSKLIARVVENCRQKNTVNLIISHCNCPERALDFKDNLVSHLPNLNININNTRGISSLYAGNKGIIVAYD